MMSLVSVTESGQRFITALTLDHVRTVNTVQHRLSHHYIILTSWLVSSGFLSSFCQYVISHISTVKPMCTVSVPDSWHARNTEPRSDTGHYCYWQICNYFSEQTWDTKGLEAEVCFLVVVKASASLFCNKWSPDFLSVNDEPQNCPILMH